MKKKLTKSNSNVILTGTLAGIAEYFNIDPTIVRIIYVFISLMGIGAPVFLYIVLALIIPANRSKRGGYYRSNHGSKQRQRKEAEKVDEDDWSDF
ncbi:PspC domain-containing protein [Tetragenococcus koreensis]|uniref:Phage shock protein C n=1 Tax=Tetragenococcus koreensis TaxID=290335 RepID=A0AAN4UCB3_9ENTE|nr:PspC domain-containing protein [Tetragenococcus koreensis]MDN5831590.1 PspC domain-containing protein [Tetragenococcus halophilus]MDN6729519.1 PspC domain-containing protein [Alkalibacterium sp.]AYW45364.1 PspC family transcriptional regulator [Tetragenococcus koreensis]MCF1584739.1 PspC domain-containing protein [Tetragenococcus koreensis]MCF1614355.1 PspC domain-containing protein [Tetragenococcus koreensis]